MGGTVPCAQKWVGGRGRRADTGVHQAAAAAAASPAARSGCFAGRGAAAAGVCISAAAGPPLKSPRDVQPAGALRHRGLSLLLRAAGRRCLLGPPQHQVAVAVHIIHAGGGGPELGGAHPRQRVGSLKQAGGGGRWLGG